MMKITTFLHQADAQAIVIVLAPDNALQQDIVMNVSGWLRNTQLNSMPLTVHLATPAAPLATDPMWTTVLVVLMELICLMIILAILVTKLARLAMAQTAIVVSAVWIQTFFTMDSAIHQTQFATQLV
jgi:antibiotic biosynthesis monooxygenase (ABM) superfamily enzyme